MILSSCDDVYDHKDKAKIEKGDLLFKTQHCRYYCLSYDGLKNPKVVVCDCDSGYAGNVSTSW